VRISKVYPRPFDYERRRKASCAREGEKIRTKKKMEGGRASQTKRKTAAFQSSSFLYGREESEMSFMKTRNAKNGETGRNGIRVALLPKKFSLPSRKASENSRCSMKGLLQRSKMRLKRLHKGTDENERLVKRGVLEDKRGKARGTWITRRKS